jgi:hypothetical protein
VWFISGLHRRETLKKTPKSSKIPFENRLIIHTPYENRFRSIRKDMDQLWMTIFKNTNVLETKLIIGTTH